MDGCIMLRCCKRDVSVIKGGSMNEAVKEYKKMTGCQDKLSVSVDEDNFLNEEDVVGGVIAVCKQGRVTLDNTLAKRLDLLEESALPSLRVALLGPSSQRVHFD